MISPYYPSVFIREFSRALSALLIGMLLLSDSTAEELQQGMVNPGYHEKPDWFKQSFLDLREDVQEASERGKRIMLYFYQDGCPYCKKLLEDNLGNRDIAKRTQKYLDVIAINMWGDQEVVDLSGNTSTEKQLAVDMKIAFTPTLVFLDEQGAIIMRLNGYYPPYKYSAVVDYVGEHLEKKSNFRDYWASQPHKASSGKLYSHPDWLKPPYQLAKRSGNKPLLVLFEQKNCAPCDELHLDVFKQSGSEALLKRFDVVLLDMRSGDSLQTPDGENLAASEWAKNLNILYAPSMIMFDASGHEVFRTEAYLRTFHVQASLEYVASGAYKTQPEFQRYVQTRADTQEEQGVHVDLMK